MPNYIKHRLVINDRYDEVLAFIKGEDASEAIDFNTIIPMPDSLDIESSTLGDDAAKYLFVRATGHPNEKKEVEEIATRLRAWGKYDEAIELGKKYLMNIATTGYKDWYDWCCDNWGTKWNAVQSKVVGMNTIEFETAWAGVVSLITTLSQRFPDVEFEYQYADEDAGSNCGTGTIKNGIASMVYPVSQSCEAYDLAFLLRPDVKDNYILVDGKYIYKEEEE